MLHFSNNLPDVETVIHLHGVRMCGAPYTANPFDYDWYSGHAWVELRDFDQLSLSLVTHDL